jgi:uncharacterized protein (DUF169 family)
MSQVWDCGNNGRKINPQRRRKSMDMKIKQEFVEFWRKYFNGAELPIAFYYADRRGGTKLMEPSSEHRCVICDLSKARKGEPICLTADTVGCGGGKRYLGFTQEITPDFEYFLSCGIPGKLEGERYKKSPELVKEAMKKLSDFEAPAEYVIFKRWDMLEEPDNPDVVIFFARPDVLSGLFTLANYDEADPNGVFAPFAAGCGSIVQYPYLESDSEHPRCVLGMFDVSARPCVPQDVLTFSVPIKKFVRMIENMEESFLITPSWKKVSQRIHQGGKENQT